MKTKKAKKAKKPATVTKKSCLKIQWSQLHTVNGVPVCPSCGEEAEMVLGFFGSPCWAHKC